MKGGSCGRRQEKGELGKAVASPSLSWHGIVCLIFRGCCQIS